MFPQVIVPGVQGSSLNLSEHPQAPLSHLTRPCFQVTAIRRHTLTPGNREGWAPHTSGACSPCQPSRAEGHDLSDHADLLGNRLEICGFHKNRRATHTAMFKCPIRVVSNT